MTKVNAFLSAKADRALGTVRIFGVAGVTNLYFIGSTVPADACFGGVVTSITLAPEKDAIGIVAVGAGVHGKRDSFDWVHFLLRVTNGEEGPRVDLEDSWQCRADRLGCNDSGNIVVKIGDETFSSNTHKNHAGGFDALVPDRQLLLRYLAGQADEAALRAAIKERGPDELEKEKAKCKQLESDLRNALSVVRSDKIAFETLLEGVRKNADVLTAALKRQWFLSRSLRRILAQLKEYGA